MGGASARLRVAFEPLQVGAHLGSVLIAKIAVFLQRLVDDPFEVNWEVGIQAHRRNGISVKNGVENDSRTLPTERQRSRRHLVENGTEGKQITAGIQLLGAHLLR